MTNVICDKCDLWKMGSVTNVICDKCEPTTLSAMRLFFYALSTFSHELTHMQIKFFKRNFSNFINKKCLFGGPTFNP